MYSKAINYKPKRTFWSSLVVTSRHVMSLTGAHQNKQKLMCKNGLNSKIRLRGSRKKSVIITNSFLHGIGGLGCHYHTFFLSSKLSKSWSKGHFISILTASLNNISKDPRQTILFIKTFFGGLPDVMFSCNVLNDVRKSQPSQKK